MPLPFAFIHTATRQELENAAAAVCLFTRDDVERGLIGQAVDRLMQMSDDDDLARRMEGSVFLMFEGYDSEPYELYQIDSCVRFFRAVTQEWPYWFHFLERERGSLGVAMRMLVDVTHVPDEDGVTRAAIVAERLDAVLLQMFEAMNGLQERLDLDEAHTMQATETVLKALELA